MNKLEVKVNGNKVTMKDNRYIREFMLTEVCKSKGVNYCSKRDKDYCPKTCNLYNNRGSLK